MMLSVKSRGVAVTLRRCCQGLRPEIAISAGVTSNHKAAGQAYRYRCCSPLRQSLGVGSTKLSKSLTECHCRLLVKTWPHPMASQSLTSHWSMAVSRLVPRDATLVQ
jgi:hypothetical protein